jgi:RNA polymerase sigma-70 factor (ECF subfamily)
MATRPDAVSAALESVVARFAEMMRRVAWRHRLSEAEVDEVVQEVRIRLWRARPGGENIAAAPASYVYRTAMSAALDLIRRRRARRDEPAELDELDAAPGPEAMGAERGLEDAELAIALERALGALPPSRRVAVRAYLAGHDREEIAALLGWTEAKTRNLLYRGLADLRARLAELGIGAEKRG